MNSRSILLPALALILYAQTTGQALSRDRDEAYRLGAFAGAMKLCEQRHDGAEKRFRWAQLRAFEEISEMSPSDRLRAMGARKKAHERGKFFGEPLNAQACERLLRLSEWQRFRNF